MDERDLWERVRWVDEMRTRNDQAARRLQQRGIGGREPYRAERTARPLLDRLTEAEYGPLANLLRSD